MPTPLPTVLDRARAAWLAGDRGAWARYQACLRQIDTQREAKPRATRRPRRPRARA